MCRADRRHRAVLAGARAAGEDRAQAPPSAEGRHPDLVPAVAGVRRPAVADRLAVGLHASRSSTDWPTAPTSTRTITTRWRTRRDAGELLDDELAHLREELDAMAAKGTLAGKAARDRCSSRPGHAAVDRCGRSEGERALMDVLLLGIYAFFVWLIFIKLKWLPWNTTSQVIVVIIPIVALTALILHAQCGRPFVERRPRDQVRGAGHPAGEGPRHRGAGRAQSAGEEGRAAVSHRPDPVPERARRSQGEARGGRGEAGAGQRGPGGCVGGCTASCANNSKSASGQVSALQPKLELARLRVRQNRELVATGAGDRFALEQAEANVDRTGRPARDGDRERGAGYAEDVGAGER